MSIIKGKTNTVAGVGKNGTGFTLFTPIWQDHLVNNASWLRADTFSWQSGSVYVAAYNHLVNDYESVANSSTDVRYSWNNPASGTLYTNTRTPSVGDLAYSGTDFTTSASYPITAVDGDDITVPSFMDNKPLTFVAEIADTTSATETIGSTTITYYRSEDGHKIVLPDQENNVMSIYNATGISWYYILDTTNQRFKLPRNKYGFTGLIDNVGNYVAPGLPNITGGYTNSHRQEFYPENAVNFTGAFAKTATVGNTAQTINNYAGVGFTFDASRSSSIYGNSDTVQPPSVQTYLYFFVGNTVEEVTTINVGQLTESLNGKADTSLNNVPANYDYIVESYADDEGNWWKLYKSGWLEQGARVIHDNTQTWKYQNFLKPFKENNYTITIAPTQLVDGGAGIGDVVVNLKNSSNTQFCWFWNANSNYGISYTACGQSI